MGRVGHARCLAERPKAIGIGLGLRAVADDHEVLVLPVVPRRGEFDPRPAYIVKLPNQQISARIEQPFSAVSTRALLDALLHDHLQTPADLQTWASQQK